METTNSQKKAPHHDGDRALELIEPGEAYRKLAGGDGSPAERLDVIVIGAGQAGLAVGYYLKRSGLRFVILDGNARVGDSWRQRWDSLRLFTPARYDSLVGMPFPAPGDYFPTKDEMGDYLESYAAHFDLPVRMQTRVRRLGRGGEGYRVETDHGVFEAAQVVVAMASYQHPRVPAIAEGLSSELAQIHSSEYRRPDQLRAGDVLLVGAGNSGSELAMELSRGRRVYMAGRHTGHLPFRVGGFLGRWLIARLLLRVVFHRLLTLSTPLGRRARPAIISRGGPLIRVRPADLAAAGVERTPRVAGVKDGMPQLDDGRVLDVANVIWCTGFDPGLSWVDLPVFGEDGEPRHTRGVVDGEPGLYFVGLHFLYAMSSTMIHGVSRDAGYVAERVIARTTAAQAEAPCALAASAALL